MSAIVDTGPLLAFFDRAERHHRWVAERVEELEAPFLVCEPVVAEAMHLLARYSRTRDALFELLQNGALSVASSASMRVASTSSRSPSRVPALTPHSRSTSLS